MPNFIHHSLDSIFLGSERVGAKVYDLYLHDVPPAALIARHGDHPSDFLELPLDRALKLSQQGDYIPEALLIALGKWRKLKATPQQQEGQGMDVTPKPDALGDLIAWSDAVRAAERAASMLSDAEVVGNEKLGTLAIVCRDAAAARDAYDLLEERANELHLVAEKPTTRRLVYLHWHGAESDARQA